MGRPREPFMQRIIPLPLALGAALPWLGLSAMAQVSTPVDTGDARSPSLPAVTVTAPATPAAQRSPSLATGTAGSTLDSPFSVTTVPGELVRQQGGTTLQDALRNVPGAQADSGFNGSHTQFFILRGAVTDSGTGSNRVLRDGVRLSNYPYTPAFVESVEVLRGPGAALGVRSEPGGTVNIVTRQPQWSNFGSVSLGAGGHGALETTVDLNRVLSAENELAARVTATRSDASEWRHVKDRLDGIQLGLAQSDGNRYHLRASVEATNQTYQPDYGLPALNGRPVAVPRDRQLGEPFGDSTTDNRIYSLHGDVALSADTRWSADFTHLEAQSTSIKNLLNGSPLAGQPAGTYARVSAWEPGTQRRIDAFSTALASTRSAGALTHQLYLGAEYYKETLNQPSLSVPAATSPPINVFNPVYGRVTAPPAGAVLAQSLTTQNLESFAASAQDQIDFGAWSVVAGLRFARQRFLYGTAGVLPVEESRWSPKLAVLRRLSDADTVYANVSTGTSPNQVASSSNQSLPSRRAAQVEVGWKSLWQNGLMVSDVAVYRLDQKNMIAADLSTPLNNFDFTTAGSARSQGIEASLTGQVTDRVNVALTYAFTDAKYLQNPVYGGMAVPNVARHAATLWAQYAWDARWKTGAGLSLQSRRFADEANTTVLPGYSRVDLSQTWVSPLADGQSIEVQATVRNVFDKHYFVSSHLHVSRWITPGQGRNAFVSATYRF
ncbi:iron complex outermembrane recepter protein [Paracidovorax valerianellae]|uniref:Iron complex outermembrane recepter protein n=2 Tax=Paracidovorax valerianellae TaxID=187868 RepID=A0A1G6VXS7_9BURK|nr:iron complex outermembrane recepter protein [Paracidovorax valerianellae]